MSYDIYLYHSDVKTALEAGKAIDGFDHTPISDVTRSEFARILLGYDYELESDNKRSAEYVHKNKKWAIQVSVFDTEIAFSVAFRDEAENAIMEASMTACEIAYDVNLKVFDPQSNIWIE